MLQIIGWLGCAILAVKLLEMAANPSLKLENGWPKVTVIFALFFGWSAVFGFAFLLWIQGGAFDDENLGASLFPESFTGPTESEAVYSDQELECLNNAKNPEDYLACS